MERKELQASVLNGQRKHKKTKMGMNYHIDPGFTYRSSTQTLKNASHVLFLVSHPQKRENEHHPNR